MLLRFAKVILHLTALTSNSMFCFSVPVILTQESTDPAFPGCNNSTAKDWCNLWAAHEGYPTPIQETELSICFKKQSCCDDKDSPTSFSSCPEASSRLLFYVEGGIILFGLAVQVIGKRYTNHPKLSNFLCCILAGSGLGGMFTTSICYRNDSPTQDTNVYTTIGALAGGIVAGILWESREKDRRRRALVVAPIPAPVLLAPRPAFG